MKSLAFLHLFWIKQFKTNSSYEMICPSPPPFTFWAVEYHQYIPMTIQCQFSVSHLGNGASLFHATSEPKQYRCPILSLSRSLWMAAQPSDVSTAPPSLLSAAKFLRVHCAPPSGSLMKMLNSVDPSTNHRGTPPLVTVLKMLFVLLMRSPLSLECSQFSVYPTASLSHPEFSSWPVRKLLFWNPCPSQDKQDIGQLTPHLWCIPSGPACLSVHTLICPELNLSCSRLSGFRDLGSWRQILPLKDWGKVDTEFLDLFCVLNHRFHIPFSSRQTFPIAFLLLLIYL